MCIRDRRKDYVLLARSKGLSKRKILWKHCLRNVLPTLVSIMAVSVPHVTGGTVTVEAVFNLSLIHILANFFGWIEISCYFSAETTFEDILESVKEQFAKELSKDVIEAKLNDLVSLEKNPILRLVPLEIKTPFLLAGTTLGGRSITAIYSNVGIIRLSLIHI